MCYLRLKKSFYVDKNYTKAVVQVKQLNFYTIKRKKLAVQHRF